MYGCNFCDCTHDPVMRFFGQPGVLSVTLLRHPVARAVSSCVGGPPIARADSQESENPRKPSRVRYFYRGHTPNWDRFDVRPEFCSKLTPECGTWPFKFDFDAFLRFHE